MKKKILFIFRYDALNDILKNEKIEGPAEFLYGMNYLDRSKYEVDWLNSPRSEIKGLIRRIFFLLQKPFIRITKLGIALDIYPLFKKKLKKADVLFCVNDSIGLGILFWKKLRFIKADVVVIMQALPERIKNFRYCLPMRLFLSSLLKKADLTLTLSKYAQKDFIKDFNLNPLKLKSFYFGVDTSFWKPLPEIKKEDFILSIGNDSNRDYKTLVNALPKNIKLKIITKKFAVERENIEIISGISNEEVRKLYNQALFVVIPSFKIKNESSGLSCALQASACKKAIIISHAPTLKEVFSDKKNCLFYEAQNSEDLNKKINLLYDNKDLLEKLEENALKNVKNFTAPKMARQTEKLLSEL